MTFQSLGLRTELHRAVSEKGYSTPTPIQRKAIPLILEGRDMMGGAQTGTGKTAGFTLPLLQRLMSSSKPVNNQRAVRALVLTPTRELAAQVANSVIAYGKHLPLRSTAVFGGVNINPQIRKLRSGVDILVATPGRLLDHSRHDNVDLSKVEIFVLDEADRILDMGFIHDIKKIIALLPKKKQTLLFSATYSKDIKRLTNDLLDLPILIDVAKNNSAPETVKQVVHPVGKKHKRKLISFLIGSKNWKQVLVFTRTRHGANRLSEQLIADGLNAAAIHSDKSQAARTKTLAAFKSGKVRVLVATDIAARGLDINQLPHVINYELPDVPEDYVHRIGRTGRAGNEGEALSLVCVDEMKVLSQIERLVKRDIPKVVVENFEPDPSINAKSGNRRSGRQQQTAKKHARKKPSSIRKRKRPHFKKGSSSSDRSAKRT